MTFRICPWYSRATAFDASPTSVRLQEAAEGSRKAAEPEFVSLAFEGEPALSASDNETATGYRATTDCYHDSAKLAAIAIHTRRYASPSDSIIYPWEGAT